MVVVSSMARLLALLLPHPPQLGQPPRLQLQGRPPCQQPQLGVLLLRLFQPQRLLEVRLLLELTASVVVKVGLVLPPVSQDTIVLFRTHVRLSFLRSRGSYV